MAIVNHSGNIDTSETWAAADEHHITGAITVGKSGDATEAKVTVSDNVIVYYDGNYAWTGVNNATAVGRLYAVASDWSNKITFMADPTTYPEPTRSMYNGLNIAYTLHVDYEYVHIYHATWGFVQLGIDSAGGDAGSVDINHSVVEWCTDMVNEPGDGDHSNAISIQNVVGVASGAIFGTADLGANVAWTGGLTVGRVYHAEPNTASFGSTSATSYGFNVSEWVWHGPQQSSAINAIHLQMIGTPPTFSDCYIGKIMQSTQGQVYITADIGGAVDFTDCVFYKAGNYGFYVTANQTGDDWTLTTCDFIDSPGYGVIGPNGAGDGTLTNCYFYRNNNRDCVEPGTATDEYQYINVEGSISLESTPNFPLEVDNVVEGAPDTNSITITFDSASGAGGGRAHGIGFVLYGTTSGIYTHQTIFPHMVVDMAGCWCSIRPDLGVFAQTGHSVTIENLKSGTTYYYKPCFIDPLGRVAEGTEGSFDTTAAAGGGGANYNIGEGGISV